MAVDLGLLEHLSVFDRTGDPDHFPDIIEFVTSPSFLNRPYLYPRQATLLKIIFLEIDLLTQYDHDVIGEWSTGFKLPSNPTRSALDPDSEATMRFEGDWGIPPDTLYRMQYLRNHGYRWFRVALAVLGRRSGKGYIGALCGAYVLWYFLMLGDPKSKYGIDRSKRLACQVFAGKKMQARDNQWRDLVNVITEAPCFQDFLSVSLSESLTVYSPEDLRLMRKGGIDTTMDKATFELVPKEATALAARGPASFMQFYDEMAHMIQTTGGSDKAEDVWESATPALDQFKKAAFIYSGSSPWTMTGKFYELASQTLQVDADTGLPVYPENFLIQLESWAIYEDWERTLIPMVSRPACDRVSTLAGIEVPKDELVFMRLKGAIQEYDDRMRKLERSNPDTFRVERRSKWSTAMDAYFPEQHVRRMFAPWSPDPETQEPRRPTMQTKGSATIDYVMHGDPGKTGSNFGFAIGHKVRVPGQDVPHVVLDFVKAWTPQDFANNEMDYTIIEAEIRGLIDSFLPVSLTFDQWNSLGMIQRLGAHSRQNNFKVTNVHERPATAALNWKTAETMKTAMSLNLIHAPVSDLLELECLFLRKLPGDKVDHPSSGPVTTKDVYDAVSAVIHELVGIDVASFMGEQFSALNAATGMPGPLSPGNDIASQFSRFTKERREVSRGNPARGIPRTRR